MKTIVTVLLALSLGLNVIQATDTRIVGIHTGDEMMAGYEADPNRAPIRVGLQMTSFDYEGKVVNWQDIPEEGIEVAGCQIDVQKAITLFMDYLTIDCGPYKAEVHTAWMGGDTYEDYKNVWGITYSFYESSDYVSIQTETSSETLRIGEILFENIDGGFVYSQLN